MTCFTSEGSGREAPAHSPLTAIAAAKYRSIAWTAIKLKCPQKGLEAGSCRGDRTPVSPGMPSAEAPAALSAAAAKPRKRKDAKRWDAQQPRQKRDPAGILKSISASTLVVAPAKIFLSKAERRKLKKRSKT